MKKGTFLREKGLTAHQRRELFARTCHNDKHEPNQHPQNHLIAEIKNLTGNGQATIIMQKSPPE